MTVPMPTGEAARLAALDAYEAFGTAPEESFDRITRIAARVLHVPIALISLVGQDRQWLKSCVGLPGVQETSREFAFCAHTILRNEALVVSDAVQDARFRDNPLVTGDPGIRFYLGFPLRTPSGQNVGTLCAIDTEPRSPTDDDLRTIEELAALAVSELELRKALRTVEEARQAQSVATADFRHLAESLEGMVFRTRSGPGNGFRYEYMSPASFDLLGFRPEEFTQDSLSILRRMSPAVAAGATRSLEAAEEACRSWEWEGPVEGASGRRKWLRGLARPELDDGKVVRWRGIFVDVTEAHAREELLIEAREEAERGARTQGRLLSRLVHEFRPPLAAILGSVRARPAQPGAAEIEQAGHRLLDLVDEMFRFSAADPNRVARHLLVVEDDPAHAQLMRKLLEDRPDVVLERTSDVTEALSRLSIGLPDLLLIDAHLPDRTPEILLEWVGRHPKARSLPVVVMSADRAESSHRRLLGLGAQRIFPKPMEIDGFMEMVEEMLALRRSSP